MEMLHCVYRLQVRPILEPSNPISRDSASESLLDIVVYFLPYHRLQTLCCLVVGQFEFRPNAKMDDAAIDPVRPIVKDDLHVVYIVLPSAKKERDNNSHTVRLLTWVREGGSFRSEIRPFESLRLNEIHHGTVSIFDVIHVG